MSWKKDFRLLPSRPAAFLAWIVKNFNFKIISFLMLIITEFIALHCQHLTVKILCEDNEAPNISAILKSQRETK